MALASADDGAADELAGAAALVAASLVVDDEVVLALPQAARANATATVATTANLLVTTDFLRRWTAPLHWFWIDGREAPVSIAGEASDSADRPASSPLNPEVRSRRGWSVIGRTSDREQFIEGGINSPPDSVSAHIQ